MVYVWADCTTVTQEYCRKDMDEARTTAWEVALRIARNSTVK